MRKMNLRPRLGVTVAGGMLLAVLLCGQVSGAEEPVLTAPPAAPKASFVETGRIGVVGAITDDLWKGGGIYEQEHFEAQLFVHAGFEGHGTRDIHVIGKVGARIPIGALNYFAVGGEFGAHPGATEDHKSVAGAFQVGPYVSLQRYFAATPLMLLLWVNPVLYLREQHPDASGNVVATSIVRVIQTGGFGLAYLF